MKRGRISALLILLAACTCLSSEARIGYDIIATVDSNRWEIHRSIQAMTFSSNSSSTGNGSFSKYAKIQEFSGMGSGQSSYALKGIVDCKEKLLLRSLEGPVLIKTKLRDIEIEDPNETEIDLSSGQIDITEQWPAHIADYRWIRYIGPGIRTKEIFNNNGDIVAMSAFSKKLNEEHLYKAYINSTVISVNLTPTSLKESWFSNKSSIYTLRMQTFQGSTSLELARYRFFTGSEPFGRPRIDGMISQDYAGDQSLSLKAQMDEFVLKNDRDLSWLYCDPDFAGESNNSTVET